MKEMEAIKQGNIYIVTTDNFFTSSKGGERSVHIQKGELIEIRYPYEWHFRTIDNKYFHAEPEVILVNCELFGIIWDNVNFGNNCNLSDIVNLELFHRKCGDPYSWAKTQKVGFLKKFNMSNLYRFAIDYKGDE